MEYQKYDKYIFYTSNIDNEDVRICGIITPREDCDEKELFRKIENVFQDAILYFDGLIEFYSPIIKYSKEYDLEINHLLAEVTKYIYTGVISLEYNISDMIYSRTYAKSQFSDTSWMHIWSLPRKNEGE